MWEARRYRRLLLFVETCEAETLTTGITSPNVITIATSKLGKYLKSTSVIICNLSCAIFRSTVS